MTWLGRENKLCLVKEAGITGRHAQQNSSLEWQAYVQAYGSYWEAYAWPVHVCVCGALYALGNLCVSGDDCNHQAEATQYVISCI